MLKIIKKADIILFIVLLILGVAVSIPGFVSASNNNDSDDLMVEIRIGNTPYGTYSINEDQEILVSDNDHINKVIIKDKKVYMEEASCHNQVCVRQGRISRGGQTIICLPNRVVVEIVSDSEGGEPDVISG